MIFFKIYDVKQQLSLIAPTWFLCDMSPLHPEFPMTNPVGNGLDLL